MGCYLQVLWKEMELNPHFTVDTLQHVAKLQMKVSKTAE
jgi:sensor histidine kinase YesM